MKTKSERLKETIKDEELRGGEFLDIHDRIMRRDGICPTIKASINKNEAFFVVVRDERNKNRWTI